ncbi:PASTA domain-containing protein [Nonomuraea wenchangensis]|uniref:PASTA domain-containing protein n=1 Tax=Nonomuraea wenchangensis TaxID=568860 RepID=A0A1I0KS97_9ACTN|nr:PASTA domain-containing protein [Nonomuraea wenchangensis]SEU28432.1 PASTA domain-containing protein [Nonomuraea wenchangensis]
MVAVGDLATRPEQHPACSTASEAHTASAPPPAVVTVTATPTSSPDEATPSAGKPSVRTPERKRLPDVVGMNLQAAQDFLQAKGFYILDDQDATGQGRLQVFDRNWQVVRQDPAAGRRVPTDTLITLYAKKIGE